MIKLHPKLLKIIEELNNCGFSPLLVGGCVRDSLLNITPKDIDIEVIGCTIDQLEKIISKHGNVDAIGKSFGILKFKVNDLEADFSVPRRENKIGSNHREFKILLEPMTAKEAAERRDFTFNALAFDPIKNKLLDFFNGVNDIKEKTIRHTSEKFNEDSLRIFRAMQFQSRFGFKIADETKLKMQEISFDIQQLSKERISEEFMKWAIKGNFPELIFDFIRDSKLEWVLPELAILNQIEQDPIFHPEKSVEQHTKLCLTHAIKICERENIIGDDKAVLIFSVLLHDIGKATTTEHQFVEKHNRIVVTSRGHEDESARLAINILNRIGIKLSIIERVIPLIKHHLAHVNLVNINTIKGRTSSLLKLSRKLKPATINELLFVIESDHFGRGILSKDVAKEINFIDNIKEEINSILKLASELNVVNKERTNILMGRHLIELGFKPGIIFSEILKKGNDAQDNLEFTNIDEAKQWVLTNFKT